MYAFSLTPKTLQNDTYYTVTVGKLITQNGIDFKDHFSWHDNLPYTYPHWLYDVFMYFTYNLSGWTGIYFLTCIFAIILGVCIYKVNSKLSENKLVSFLITIGSLFLLENYIAARAQLVTFSLFILLIYNIEKILLKPKFINTFYIIIIHLLIANLHVAVWPFAFVLYLPYIGEYLVCEFIDFLSYRKLNIIILKKKLNRINNRINIKGSSEVLEIQKTSAENNLKDVQNIIEKIKTKRKENLENPYKIKYIKNTNTRWLIIIMFICILTGFCTPLKIETPYNYTVLTLQGNETNYISEHLPMTLVENIKILCTCAIILGILIFTKAKIRLTDLFMLGGLAYLMLASRRQASMFVLIGTVAFTKIITNLIWLYTGKNGKDLLKKYITPFICFVLSAIIFIMSFYNINKHIDDEYVNEKTYPVQASEWIIENLNLDEIKLYNDYNFGSYLIYKGIPVFVDSRADLYAPEFNTLTGDVEDGRDIFSDFVNSSNISKYYGDIFEKYNITHVFIKENSKLNMLIKNADSEKYKQIYPNDESYEDKNFVIYEILEY